MLFFWRYQAPIKYNFLPVSVLTIARSELKCFYNKKVQSILLVRYQRLSIWWPVQCNCVITGNREPCKRYHPDLEEVVGKLLPAGSTNHGKAAFWLQEKYNFLLKITLLFIQNDGWSNIGASYTWEYIYHWAHARPFACSVHTTSQHVLIIWSGMLIDALKRMD